MKHTLTLYYSVSNGGDGSAYPHFSLSKELAEIDQEIQSELGEGWGEDCTGEITLESDSPITVVGKYTISITKESLIEGLQYHLDGGYNKNEHIKKKAQEFLERINKIQ